MTDKQPEALRLADNLLKYLGGNTSIQAAAELRRLHEVNAELVEALKEFSECELTDENCASVEIATKRIRAVARAALAKAEGK